jgi:hypothetical protein
MMILRDFSELDTTITQIKPNKPLKRLSFCFLFSFKMWTGGFFRVHVSEMSYFTGSIIKVGAFFMLVLVKIQFTPQGISQSYSLHLPNDLLSEIG